MIEISNIHSNNQNISHLNLSTNNVFQVGSLANQIISTRENPQRYRVYLIKGISPALNCATGGGQKSLYNCA